MPWVWKKLQNRSQWRLVAHPAGTWALAQDGEFQKLLHFPALALPSGDWSQTSFRPGNMKHVCNLLPGVQLPKDLRQLPGVPDTHRIKLHVEALQGIIM